MSKKTELKKVLIEVYGYEESELYEDGKIMTNARLEQIISNEEKSAQEVEEEKESKVIEEKIEVVEDKLDSFFDSGVYEKESTQFKDGDLINVMSGINGLLIHRSRETGKEYRFNGFGQIRKMEYKELVNIKNLTSKTLDEGWIVILNKDIIKDFGYEDMYENILTPKNIKEIFKKETEEVREFVSQLPKSMQVTIIDTAREMYRSGKLDRKSIIDVIQNTFDISLEDNAPISTFIKG